MLTTPSLNSFATVKPWNWLVIVVISLLIHGIFLLSYQAPAISTGAKAIGQQGIEIGLKKIEPPPAQAKSTKKVLVEETPIKKKKTVAKKPVINKSNAEAKPKPEVALKQKVADKPRPAVKKTPAVIPDPTVTEPSDSEPALIEEANENSSAVASENTTLNNSDSAISAPNIPSTLGGGDPKLEKNYKATLLLWLERYKRYPSAAKRRRQEDTILLEFTIDEQGNLLSHKLINTSKYKKLNQAVEKMIAKASPLPSVPAEIVNGKNRFTYTVPIEFNLR